MKRTKEERKAFKNYNIIAESYHEMRTKENPEGWFYNELLEMPATLGLLGSVKGKKILDFGCGTGIYAKILTKKEAKVKGFDISSAMIKIARGENPELELKIGSGYNIPFREKFDIVIAPLVIHYLKDWDKVFQQIKKVLKKDGFFIFSTGNPVFEVTNKIKISKRKPLIREFQNYFKEKEYFSNWKNHNKNLSIKAFFYHKTYETIIKTILRNGFNIIDYKDAYPTKKAKRLFPKEYYQYS